MPRNIDYDKMIPPLLMEQVDGLLVNWRHDLIQRQEFNDITSHFPTGLLDGTDWNEVRYAGNPILDIGAPGEWDDYRVSRPYIIYNPDDGRFWMYYMGNSGSPYQWFMGLAFSEDLIHWEKYQNNPILVHSPNGVFEQHHYYGFSILRYKRKWHCYFAHNRGEYKGIYPYVRIFHATSDDGIYWWADDENPVIDVGSPGSWDSFLIHFGQAIRVGDRVYIYYSARDDSADHIRRIGVAISENGHDFTKYAGNPVLNIGAPGEWDDTHIDFQGVIIYRYNWFMIYAGYDGTQFRGGLAISNDGITWRKYAGNPIFDKGQPGEWDDASATPMVVRKNVDKWHMYYAGYDGTHVRIGVAIEEVV